MLRSPSEWIESSTRHTVGSDADPAEQVGLLTQHGDVGQTVTAVGEHHRQLRQHDTGIVRRTAPPGVGHRRRQPGRQPDPIGQLGEQQRPGMRRHTLAVTGHLHPLRSACTVHFRSALPLGRLILRQDQFRLAGGPLRGPARSHPGRYRKVRASERQHRITGDALAGAAPNDI